MMKSGWLVILAALTACTERQPAAAVPDVEQLSRTGSAGVGKPVPPSPTPVPLAYPTAFQGRWGLVPADCDVSRSDAKGAMKINKDKIDFYESRARVVSVIRSAPNEVTADLAFKGEGQEWSRRTTLKLIDGGTELVRIEQPPVTQNLYTKC